MWTTQAKDAIWKKWCNDDHLDDIVRAERLASFAVELVAARGGEVVEVPDGFEQVLREMETRGTKREAQAVVTVRGLLASHRAKGATVATLHAAVEACEAALQDAQTDGAMWEAEAQRSRAEAASLQATVAELEADKERLNGEAWQAAVMIAALVDQVGDLHSGARRIMAERDRAEDVGRHLAQQTVHQEQEVRLLVRECGVRDDSAREIQRAREAAEKETLALRTEVERLKAEADRIMGLVQLAERKHTTLTMRAETVESRLAAIRERFAALECDAAERVNLRWVLEGDAPQEAKPAWPCICGFLSSECAATRHPCSDTCTHDDAATPGHPERVREQSAAVARAALGMPEDPIAALAKEVGVKTGREISSFRLGHENGAEAMRAVCWEAVQRKIWQHGLHNLEADFKAAIEGATP